MFKLTRRALSLVLTVAIALSLAAITPLTAFAADYDASKVRFTETNITLKVGETYKLNYYFEPDGSNGAAWFHSSNDRIADVNAKTGLVKAIYPGTVKITAGLIKNDGSQGSTQATISVTVEKDNQATSFEMPSTLTLTEGDTYQLGKLIPEGSVAASSIKYWYQGHDQLVRLRIDDNGLLHADGAGTATLYARMGNIEKTCELTIVHPDGWTEPNSGWVVSIDEGWYVMRCMYNFVNIAADGTAELKWTNPTTPFYIKEFDNGTDIVTTIKTADGRYLGVSGSGKNGDKVVAQSTPYYWQAHNGGFYINDGNNPYMLMNANGEKNADGTKLIVWDNKKWTTPLHGMMQLVPADGPNPQYVKPQVVSPFEKTKPFTLRDSSGNNNQATIFGMTLDVTTVAQMKALYGEPDDVWYEEFENDYQTAWYFYRNNWTDMMLVAARRPVDAPTVLMKVVYNEPIESDACIVIGVYTNEIDLNLGSNTIKESNQTPIVLQYVKDEVTGSNFAVLVGTHDFYWWHSYYYFHGEGSGYELGAMEHGVYYALNGYLATKGWKMLELDELASFNLYKEAAADRASGNVAMLGKDTGKKSEHAAGEGEYWSYMSLIAVTAEKFRAEMWSGKYNKIAIGYAQGDGGDIDSWEEEDHIKDPVWGQLIAELGYQSGIENAANNSKTDTPVTTATTTTAKPTNTKFMLNGAEVALPAYEIGGNNYVKLRDVAALLKTRFDVRWKDGKAKLYNRAAYTAVGGELAAIGADSKSATLSATDFVWGDTGAVVTGLTAYNIGNNNYIKLRDIAKLFDFDVDWRDGKAWIEPDVSPYTED
jgi:hypothetical protein